MASPSITTNYVGDVLDYVITETVLGNQAVEKGSVYVIPDVPDKINIGKMVSSANPIIDREAMPSTKSATSTWSESTLTPVDMMIYVPDINPRLFEHVWRPFQPKGSLPDKVLDPRIQKVFADNIMAQARLQVGNIMWQGDNTLAASSPLHFFNGYITRATASSTNIDVTNQGTVTVNNVLSILAACELAIPDALFEDPDMMFHMNTGDFRKFQQAIQALTYKGQGPADQIPAIYNGREIRHYSGLPANKILVAKANTGTESQFYAAVDKPNDMENFKIELLRPEGELYFFKALFKMDAGFRLDSETVFYAGS
jgi:hypothetical protein